MLPSISKERAFAPNAPLSSCPSRQLRPSFELVLVGTLATYGQHCLHFESETVCRRSTLSHLYVLSGLRIFNSMDVGQSMKVSSTGLRVSILITPSGGRCGRLASLWLCFAGLIASRGLLPRLLWTMDTKREISLPAKNCCIGTSRDCMRLTRPPT